MVGVSKDVVSLEISPSLSAILASVVIPLKNLSAPLSLLIHVPWSSTTFPIAIGFTCIAEAVLIGACFGAELLFSE